MSIYRYSGLRASELIIVIKCNVKICNNLKKLYIFNKDFTVQSFAVTMYKYEVIGLVTVSVTVLS